MMTDERSAIPSLSDVQSCRGAYDRVVDTVGYSARVIVLPITAATWPRIIEEKHCL